MLQALCEKEEMEMKYSKRGYKLTEDSQLDGYDKPLPLVHAKTRRRSREEMILETGNMATILQLWDFLYTFSDVLKVKELPNIGRLKEAFIAVEKGQKAGKEFEEVGNPGASI